MAPQVHKAPVPHTLNILHITPSMSPHWGGPVAVVSQLIPALSAKGIHSEIATTTGHRVGDDPMTPTGIPSHIFHTGPPAHIWTAYSGKLARFLDTETPRFDLVHIHELWHYAGFAASRAALKHDIPYVLTVHGALEEWTLRHKSIRKRIYRKLVQDRILDSASAIHAITRPEADRVAELGYQSPIITIPNGVSENLIEDFRHTDASDFLARYPELGGKRVILFMGRMHVIKGADILARSFATIAERFEDAMILFAGPDEDGARRGIETILQRSGTLDRAVFTGMLTGDDWRAAFQCADVFVLSSHSEGFSVAILEAMSARIPVIISTRCNFPEVAESEAGFVVQPDDAEVAGAIEALLSDKSLRDRMGENGRRLIEESYTWTSISESVASAYRTIIENRKS